MTAIAPKPALALPLVELLDRELGGELDGVPRHLWERALGRPARDFLSRPGKQFRARLVQAAWRMAGGASGTMPSALPLVVELLHAGSLIVDDIEDGAHERRGGPALHRVHGTPLALNTGNWMYFWPLRLIDRLPMDAMTRAALTREATLAVERCHRGQALDLALSISSLRKDEISQVVRTTTRLKTGALMELAAVLGGIAANAAEQQVEVLRRFGRGLGEGLQMLDDLGGLTSPRRAHKAAEDLINERPTWPWAWLATTSSEGDFERCAQRLARVSAGQESPDELAAMLRAAVAGPGKQRVHARLAAALTELEDAFGASALTGALRAEIVRLENSYE